MELCLSTRMWAGLPLEEALAAAAAVRAVGVTALELSADFDKPHLDPLTGREGVEAIQPLLEGFRVAAVSAAHPDLARTESEGGVEAVEWTVKAIRAAEQLGAGVVVVELGGTDIEVWEHAWERATSALRLVLHRTRSSRVRLAVELTRDDVLDSLKKANRLLMELPDPRLGVALDTATLFYRRIEWREALRIAGKRVYHIHLRDATRQDDRLPFGKGQVSPSATVKALWDAHYRGVLSLELLDLARHGLGVTDALLEALPRFQEPLSQLPGAQRRQGAVSSVEGAEVDEDEDELDEEE